MEREEDEDKEQEPGLARTGEVVNKPRTAEEALVRIGSAFIPKRCIFQEKLVKRFECVGKDVDNLSDSLKVSRDF